MEEKRKVNFSVTGELVMNSDVNAGMKRSTKYVVECLGIDGELKWVEEFGNLVVNVGLNDSLDKHFKGSGYSAAWYVGLASGTPSFAAGDTMASHAGWFEIYPYAGLRPALTLGSVSSQSVDNSASKASYAITATMVIGGAFVNTGATGTAGTLYGGGAFSGGNRSVLSGDTLNVTCTLTAAAA